MIRAASSNSLSSTPLAFLLLLLAAGRAAADDKEPTGPNDPALRAVCLEFVTVALLAPDPARLAALIDKDAQTKNRGPGSGLKIIDEVTRKKAEFVQKIRVHGVQFFTSDTLAETQKQHPELKYLAGDRVPKHLPGGLGCLFQFRHIDQGRLYTSCLVVKKVADKPLIVYIDDEP